jgi:hypothetical protein
LIAAAATGGAIIGFGARHNDWAGPFATLGYQVMRGMGVADAPRLIPTAAGLAAHTSWMVLWGIAFAALSYRKTPAITVLFALFVGLGASLLARSLVPAALGAVKFAAMLARSFRDNVLTLWRPTVGVGTVRFHLCPITCWLGLTAQEALTP